MSDTIRQHIVVKGHVQGVGFRYFTQRRAQVLGLVGYVRNLSGGAVEIEAEGPAEQVAELVARVKAGPPGSRVREVSVSSRPVLGNESEFEIRFSMF